MYLAILKDQEGVPDFFHPSELMGNSPQQVKQFLSEDTPMQYIQGVYSPQDYLKMVQSPKFAQTIASFSPNMPEPAIKKQVANLIDYVQSFIASQNDQSQIDIAQLANVANSGSEENFDTYEVPNVPEPTVIYPTYPPQVKDPKTGKLVFLSGYPPLQTNGNNVQVAPVQPKTETKYFTESGIKFKLENGELYKKEWVDEPIEPYMDKVTDPKTGEEKEVEIIPDFRLVNKETGKPVKLSKYVLQQAVWKKLQS